MENKIANLQQVTYPNLPLAIYREIVAHLEQFAGVVVEVLQPEDQAFSYDHSQVRGLVIKSTYPQNELIKCILDHYSSIYGAYNIS